MNLALKVSPQVCFYLSQMKSEGGRGLRPPSSADSTSGYFSSGASYVDDSAGKIAIDPLTICRLFLSLTYIGFKCMHLEMHVLGNIKLMIWFSVCRTLDLNPTAQAGDHAFC